MLDLSRDLISCIIESLVDDHFLNFDSRCHICMISLASGCQPLSCTRDFFSFNRPASRKCDFALFPIFRFSDTKMISSREFDVCMLIHVAILKTDAFAARVSQSFRKFFIVMLCIDDLLVH